MKEKAYNFVNLYLGFHKAETLLYEYTREIRGNSTFTSFKSVPLSKVRFCEGKLYTSGLKYEQSYKAKLEQ